ncbi:MAG: diphthine--ammonia ligase [Candidatus ainarchaeum sp.]|nr:diphthine--ammonia ligase [Candidatus ainarchaeum sp.]
MKAACLFSGGKDSVYATFWGIFQGWEIILVSVESEEYSMMFHHPNINKTKLQAKEMGLEIKFVETDGKKELEDLKKKLVEIGAEAIITGAIASEYQKQRIEKIGEELGIPVYSPLWHKEDVLIKEIKEYFETYVTAVSAEGLNEKHLGMDFKELNVQGIHKMLEGGEGETFVANAPFFKNRIAIKKWKKKWDGVRGVAEIEV